MHPAQQEYCESVKRQFPEYFKNVRVLDVGSLDINGNNKYLFDNCEYIGLDVVDGKNVDVVSIAHEYEPETKFNTIISTNSLEHDIYYEKTLRQMVKLLLPKGLLVISACNSWQEHGTRIASPHNSGTSSLQNAEWANYYRNVTPEMIKKSIKIEKHFHKYHLGINRRDVVFWGVKNEIVYI